MHIVQKPPTVRCLELLEAERRHRARRRSIPKIGAYVLVGKPLLHDPSPAFASREGFDLRGEADADHHEIVGIADFDVFSRWRSKLHTSGFGGEVGEHDRVVWTVDLQPLGQAEPNAKTPAHRAGGSHRSCRSLTRSCSASNAASLEAIPAAAPVSSVP